MKRHFSVLVVVMMFFILVFHRSAFSMELVASWGGEISGSATYQDYIYLAQRNSVSILNAKDKNHICEVGRYTSSDGDLYSLALKWPVVFFWEANFVGSYYKKFSAIDVSDPSHPSKIKSVDLGASKSDVGVGIKGNQLVVDDGRVLSFYDISDPAHPAKMTVNYEKIRDKRISEIISASPVDLSMIPQNVVYRSSVRSVLAAGNRAYILQEKGLMDVIDVSNPKKPKYLGPVLNSQEIKNKLEATKVLSHDSCLIKDKYKICEIKFESEDGPRRDLVIQDVSDKKKSRVVATLEQGSDLPLGPGSIRTFGLSGAILYVVKMTERDRGHALYSLGFWDLSTPEKPRPIDECDDLAEIPSAISISGDLIYIANEENGLAIFRHDQPAN